MPNCLLMNACNALFAGSWDRDGTVASEVLEELEKTDFAFTEDFLSVRGTLRECEELNLDDRTERVVATDGTETFDTFELRIEKALPPPCDRTADAESRYEASDLNCARSSFSTEEGVSDWPHG